MRKQLDYYTRPGEYIDTTVRNLIALAKEKGKTVWGEHNDIRIKATPTSTIASVLKFRKKEEARQERAYLKSPAFRRDQERQRKQEEADRRRQLMFEGAIAVAPLKMALKNVAQYKEVVKINGNTSLGRQIIEFADTWARLMEARIAKGDTVAKCAKKTCDLADRGAMSGYSYGVAVNFLSEVWIHGEELRRWHNIQEGGTGDEKGTINPALFSIG